MSTQTRTPPQGGRNEETDVERPGKADPSTRREDENESVESEEEE